MSRHGQEGIFGAGKGVISGLKDTDYDRVATAFGGYGERVGNFEQMAPALQRAFDSGLPAVVNLDFAPEVVHPLMDRMVGRPANEAEVVIPYYENVPALPEE